MNSIARHDSGHTKGLRHTGFNRFVSILVLTVLLMCFQQSPAQGADPVEDGQTRANAQLERGEFQKALETYLELFRQDPGNPDVNFNLGRAAFESGDYETAIMAFERVLIYHPDAARAKLEIARCYFNLGSQEMAEQYFNEVLAQNPPEAVRLNIEKYLEAIRASKKEHFVSAKVTFGIDFDDNVNASPTNSNIDMSNVLGDVITVSLDRPENDQIYTSMATVSYLYRPLDGQVSWKASGSYYNAVYSEAEDLDLSFLDFKAGASIGRDRVAWDVYVIANHLNLDYGRYLQIYGAGSSVNIMLTPAFMVNFDGKLRKKNYFTDDPRDGDNISATLSPIVAFGRNRVSLSLGWEHENAREDVNTYDRINAIGTYEVILPYSTTAFLSYWYQDTRYEDIYPLFNKKRNDDVQYISTGLSKTLSTWRYPSRTMDLDLTLSYTYTRSDSDIDLYTYTKNIISAGLSVSF